RPGAVNALDQPHIAAADIRPDRLSAVRFDGLTEPRRDSLEGLVPCYADELARSLRPTTAHRIQEALRRARVSQVVGDLIAQRSPGVGMVRIAAKRDRFAVFDGDNPAAGVGAVEWTRAADLSVAAPRCRWCSELVRRPRVHLASPT